MVAATVVARLTTERAVHELTRTGDAYVLTTTVGGETVCERELTQRQAMEWVDTTKAGGGVVFGRGAP